jgi:hypothetical protein
MPLQNPLQESHILIATGGYLNDEVRLETLDFSENDKDYEDEDYEDFGEYVDDCISEKVAEYEQGFSSVIVIPKLNVPDLIEKLSKLHENKL